MNKYVRAVVVVPFGVVKMLWTKLFHMTTFHGSVVCQVSPFTEITMDRTAQLSIGKSFKMRDGAKIRVRKGASCVIGDRTSVNSNNVIACHERIKIGSGCQFSPNVQIYDHDHDFRNANGIGAMKYKTARQCRVISSEYSEAAHRSPQWFQPTCRQNRADPAF